jgi:hypothetical protein
MHTGTLNRRIGRLEVVRRKSGPECKLQQRVLAQVADEDLEHLLEASGLYSVRGNMEQFTIEQQGAVCRYEAICRATTSSTSGAR